jgi:Ligand-gated ion channel
MVVSWRPLGVLLLYTHSIGRAEDTPLTQDGSPSCPCVSMRGAAATSLGGGGDDVWWDDVWRQPDTDLGANNGVSPINYGFGCQPHDINSTACTTTIPSPDYCTRKWCWVDPNNCNIHNRFDDHVIGNNFRSYSYATCRDIDSFTGDVLIRSLSGKTIRTGFLHNNGGWKGAYSTKERNFDGPLSNWHGPAVAFAIEAARVGNYTIELGEPPEFLWFKSLGYFGLSQVDFCVYATSLGFLDLCVGDITVSSQLAGAVDFYVLHSQRIRIMISTSSKSKYKQFRQSSATIFQPFTRDTWLFIIFVVIPLFGALLVIHEYGKDGSLYPRDQYFLEVHDWRKDKFVHEDKANIYRYVIRSIHFTFLALLQQGYAQPVVSAGARWHIMGISFFILVIIAVYTANLAAILNAKAWKASVDDLDDVVYNRYRICATRSVYESISQVHRIDERNFAVDPPELGGDGKPGFQCSLCESRQRVLDYTDPILAKTDSRYCHVAVTYEDDLTVEQGLGRHCNKTMVGTSLGTVEIGFPVFDGISKQLVANFYQVRNLGIYDDAVLQTKPKSTCPIKRTANASGEGFTIADLTGIWTVSFGYAVLGLLMAFGLPLCKRQFSRKSLKSVHRIDQNGERINRLEPPDIIAVTEALESRADANTHTTSPMDDDSSESKARKRRGGGSRSLNSTTSPMEFRKNGFHPKGGGGYLATVTEDERSLDESLRSFLSSRDDFKDEISVDSYHGRRKRRESGDSTSSWPMELRDGFVSPFPKGDNLATVKEDEVSLDVEQLSDPRSRQRLC